MTEYLDRLDTLVKAPPDGELPALHTKAVEVARNLIPMLAEITRPYTYTCLGGCVQLEFEVYEFGVCITIDDNGTMHTHMVCTRDLTIADEYETSDCAQLVAWIKTHVW